MSQWLSRMARRVRALVHRDALDRDLDAEIRFHLEMEAEELVRMRGLAPEEARRRALIAFGGVERYKEEHRDARGVRWLEGAVQDARYAARSLRRSAGFTLSSVLVLALGIGSTTAVFSAVNAVLLDPQYDRLVIIFQQFSPTNRATLSVVDFRAIEEQQRSFSAVGALRWREAGYTTGGEPERAWIGAATSGFFRALGVRPVLGRAIEPGDERQGAPPVTLVSQALAVRAFGGEAAAVGRSITVDGIAYTVVGVLPPGVSELAGVRAQIWPALQLEQPERRGPFGLRVIGRLATGVTLDAAARDLAGISERIFPLWASSFQQSSARLTPVPIRAALLRHATKMLGVFSAAVGLVLLIAVANVASLMLVRAVGRWRELSLRTVLGATRVRLVRLLVTESIILAAAGAAAGVVVGALGLRALIAIGPRMPHLAAAHLDLRAVAFAVAVALLAGTIVGAYPVAMLLGRDVSGALQGGERTVGAGRQTHTMRSAFVIVQFALALPLLVVAGLLLNSFLRLQRVDPGFDPRHVLTVRISLPTARYPADSVGDSTIAGYWARALPRLREIPGVLAVGLSSAMPPDNNGSSFNNFDLIDRPVAPGAAQPVSPWLLVDTAYFTALDVRLLEGRLFTPADTGGPAPVVVVSRSWARHYFPEGNVVGRKVISGGCMTCPPMTVVGVVGDVRYEGLDDTRHAVYEPLTQGWQRDLNVFVRTAASPAEVAGRVRAALRSVDPSVPLDDVAPMEARLDASVAQPRHWTMLLGGFAVAALTLAAVGIFGMLSYMVSTRRREIGVRMALGAQENAVVALIVRRGMGLALAGAVIGLAAAMLGTRWLQSALFDVSATDPSTLAAVTLLLLGVALIASWLPARRAAAVSPVEAIRLE